MGVAAGGECHESVAAALGAACAVYPVSRDDGSLVSCVGVTASGVALRPTSAAGVVGAVVEVPASFPACDAGEAYADITLLWGSGLGALVAVWVVKTFVLKLLVNQ